MIFHNHCEILKSTYIEENVQMAASVDSFTVFIAIWFYVKHCNV